MNKTCRGGPGTVLSENVATVSLSAARGPSRALCSHDQPESYCLHEWSRIVRPLVKHGNVTSKRGGGTILLMSSAISGHRLVL